MLVYLNSDWEPAHGGEVSLLPFLAPPVVVPPKLGTVVFFRSDRILHRVLPSWAPRLCFTLWVEAPWVNADEDLLLRSKHLAPAFRDALRKSPLQRVLSRAVYEEEYAESLRQCFGAASTAGRVSLQLHQAHLRQLPKTEEVAACVAELRASKASC
ncbi:hypothetical protein DIPPA_13760 [Diplonema papillatum]|nr:hypothetical protein DIPPA_13760 [Diplonema papillatum]